MSNKPVWAIPTRIRIKATGEVGRLELIYYDYADNDVLLYLRMDDGRVVRVLGTEAEHAAKSDEKRGAVVSELQAWDFVRHRWQPESHVWDGLDSIPIETARNEVLDLCDGIDYWRKRAEAAEAVLAAFPMASMLRFVEATLMRAQPLQFDVEAVEKWLDKKQVQP